MECLFVFFGFLVIIAIFVDIQLKGKIPPDAEKDWDLGGGAVAFIRNQQLTLTNGKDMRNFPLRIVSGVSYLDKDLKAWLVVYAGGTEAQSLRVKRGGPAVSVTAEIDTYLHNRPKHNNL